MHILQFKLQVSAQVGFLLYVDPCVKPLKLNNDNNYVKKKVAGCQAINLYKKSLDIIKKSSYKTRSLKIFTNNPFVKKTSNSFIISKLLSPPSQQKKKKQLTVLKKSSNLSCAREHPHHFHNQMKCGLCMIMPVFAKAQVTYSNIH